MEIPVERLPIRSIHSTTAGRRRALRERGRNLDPPILPLRHFAHFTSNLRVVLILSEEDRHIERSRGRKANHIQRDADVYPLLVSDLDGATRSMSDTNVLKRTKSGHDPLMPHSEQPALPEPMPLGILVRRGHAGVEAHLNTLPTLPFTNSRRKRQRLMVRYPISERGLGVMVEVLAIEKAHRALHERFRATHHNE